MRLGIMGGTFDPIHLGHLSIAGTAMAEAGLEEVVFLPDGDPPHKTPGVAGEHRLFMVNLAIQGHPGFWASDMELLRAGKTYTVDTLEELLEKNPKRELFYIVGSDTLKLFPTWETAWKVADLCQMLIAPRPGDEREEIAWYMRKMYADYGLYSTLLSTAGPDVSSTRIRHLVREGRDISPLVPAPVANYIQQQGLYLPRKE